MFEEFDLQALRRVPQFAHYFRYPLRHQDFHGFWCKPDNYG